MLARSSARPRRAGGAGRARPADALFHEPGGLPGAAPQPVERALPVKSGSIQSPRPSELAFDHAREALDGLGSRDELAVDEEGGRPRHAEANPLVHALLHRGRVGPARETALEAREV